MKELKTSSRIAFHFTLFTTAITLLILLCINVTFFLAWHRADRNYLATIALQQNRVQAVQAALQQKNKRFIMPLGLREVVGPMHSPDQEKDILNYTRKLIDIIQANDGRRYMVYHDDTGKAILLDITENINRQYDLAAVSLIILMALASTSYWISKWLVKRSLKDLYRLAGGVKEATIENLHTQLAMDHLPEDDEINIVANAIDEMKKKIHTQVQSIKDFVSHVSHEFKTPLMVMRSDIDLAKKTQDYDELIEKNMQTVLQMQTLLDGLLVLTTAQTGTLERTDVNMSSLVERVCDNIKKKYLDKDIIVHKHISSHVFISTHAGAAESIISNILDNAYKYTPEGGEIVITLDEKSCVISDNGPGIAKEHREKIRQPFWQADKNRQDGIGLGLSIVQKLTELLGWKVALSNKEEKGTMITFTFPTV